MRPEVGQAAEELARSHAIRTDSVGQHPRARTTPGLKAGWVGTIQNGFFAAISQLPGNC